MAIDWSKPLRTKAGNRVRLVDGPRTNWGNRLVEFHNAHLNRWYAILVHNDTGVPVEQQAAHRVESLTVENMVESLTVENVPEAPKVDPSQPLTLPQALGDLERALADVKAAASLLTNPRYPH